MGRPSDPYTAAPLAAAPQAPERGAVTSRRTDAPDTLRPIPRAIQEPGQKLSSVDAFEGVYRLKRPKCTDRTATSGVDALMMPTFPDFVTQAEIEADLLRPNARLGTLTNVVNLLDLCGLGVANAPSRTAARSA